MAIYRELPRCPNCGEIIANPIHFDKPDFIGDTFIRWEYLEHKCKFTSNTALSTDISIVLKKTCTPIDKAILLLNKFRPHSFNGASEEYDENMEMYHAKKCALICISEMKTIYEHGQPKIQVKKYLEQVEKELNELK